MTTLDMALAVAYNETYAAAAKDETIDLATAHKVAATAVRILRIRAYNDNYVLCIKAVGKADEDTLVWANKVASLIAGI
jgi:hypothetical protein